MELARDILAWALVLGGCFFTVVGAFGLVRLPDVYTRLHSAGLVDTAGAGLLLILVFLFFTSPATSNAFANSAYSAGVKPILAGDDEREDAPSKP